MNVWAYEYVYCILPKYIFSLWLYCIYLYSWHNHCLFIDLGNLNELFPTSYLSNTKWECLRFTINKWGNSYLDLLFLQNSSWIWNSDSESHFVEACVFVWEKSLRADCHLPAHFAGRLSGDLSCYSRGSNKACLWSPVSISLELLTYLNGAITSATWPRFGQSFIK